MQAGEACDDGNDDPRDDCTNACELARCGDGIVHRGVEECDDANSFSGDACSTECKITTDIGWRTVTGGEYNFGDLSNSNAGAVSVTISSFEMTRSEITVAQYKACVDAGSCALPKNSSGCTYSG